MVPTPNIMPAPVGTPVDIAFGTAFAALAVAGLATMARGFGAVEPPPIGGRRPRDVALPGPAVKRPKAPRGGRGGKGGDDANGKGDA